jgi:hypothetical protein
MPCSRCGRLSLNYNGRCDFCDIEAWKQLGEDLRRRHVVMPGHEIGVHVGVGPGRDAHGSENPAVQQDIDRIFEEHDVPPAYPGPVHNGAAAPIRPLQFGPGGYAYGPGAGGRLTQLPQGNLTHDLIQRLHRPGTFPAPPTHETGRQPAVPGGMAGGHINQGEQQSEAMRRLQELCERPTVYPVGVNPSTWRGPTLVGELPASVAHLFLDGAHPFLRPDAPPFEAFRPQGAATGDRRPSRSQNRTTFQPTRRRLQEQGMATSIGVNPDIVAESNVQAGHSQGYQGQPDRACNKPDDVPDELNCAFWITNLPADVTVKQVLGAIRAIGRVFAFNISTPMQPGGTAAAKLTFFTVKAAQKFVSICYTPILQNFHGRKQDRR